MKKIILITLLVTATNLLIGQTVITLVLPNPCSSLSIENGSINQSNGLNITVSPNPTCGNFTLYVNSNKTIGNAEIKLLNSKGVCLMTERFYSSNLKCVKQLDFRRLPAGLYLLNVSNGKESKTTKLIINKN